MEVSKKSIFIVHRRETSNALNASVRCEQKRLQSCLKSFPPIIVFRKLSGRKFRVFRRSPEVRGLTNMRWFQDAGDTGCTAWIPWEGTASNHWDLRWHWYFLCWHTLKQSTCSADIPTWSKLFYNINLGKRSHNNIMISKTVDLNDRNSIVHMLYKDSY